MIRIDLGVVGVLGLVVASWVPAAAYDLAISQYGQVTASLPWAVAREKGYFTDEGVKIDQIIAGKGGGTTLRNMMASDLPYGEVATSAALAAINAGLDIVIVATASNHIGEIAMVVRPDSSVRDVRDLAGKSVGFTNPKSTSEMLIRLALERAHLADQVRLVATGGFGGGIALLQSGGIDATSIIDPILTLKPKEFRVIFHFADLIPHMTWLVDVTTRKFATEQPELVRKLIRIRRRSVQYIYRNHQDAMQIYAEVWQQEAKAVATYFPKYFGYNGEWSEGDFEEDGLENISKGLRLTGEAKGPVDWAAAIDQQFLPKDLQRPHLAALTQR